VKELANAPLVVNDEKAAARTFGAGLGRPFEQAEQPTPVLGAESLESNILGEHRPRRM
jgi:hypothetical protein